MRKFIKISLIIALSFCLLFFIGISYFFFQTSSAKIDPTKLVSFNRSISFYDNNCNFIFEQSNGRSLAEISKLPEYTKNAFIAIEDKRFYMHKGIDYKGLFRATLNNIKSLSFKEGGSTITQQLVKNTHLTNKKTFKRKLYEIKLAKELEKKYSKDEILEKYLNTIYFGDNCYGITSASEHYFNKSPYQLNLNESAVLAGIIKAPSNYSPYSNYQKCFNRKKIVLDNMLNQNLISKDEHNASLNKKIPLYDENALETKEYDYFYLVNKELNSIIKNSPYKSTHLNVYTYYDKIEQSIISKNTKDIDVEANKSSILISNNGEIKAYFSTCGNTNRQLGSTIKPLLCYAPAIENNLVCSETKILDEKTKFNDYSPKNYNDKYYGNISIKESLAKSSNICALKLLNSVGIEKACRYLDLLDIPLSKNDKNLSLGLGACEKGVNLINITGAYSVFNNQGKFIKPKTIAKITDKNGNLIYFNNKITNSVFSGDTISIMNDMMRNVVTNGSAKKLSFSKMKLYAKTGTVGSQKGNTDAYTISYNKNYVLGTWYGNKENRYLDNSISGGTMPAITSARIWNDLYLNEPCDLEIENDPNIIETEIDKISYDENGKIVLADKVSPKQFTKKVLLRKNYKILESSNRFSSPKIEKPIISVKNNEIIIRLCMTQCINAKIYKENNGKKYEVYDTKDGGEIYIDKDVTDNCIYSYSIVPYFVSKDETYYGKEIILKKIKTPTHNDVGDDWWNNNVN